MYPPRFRYEAPRSLDDALSLLAENDEAKILAGGQSLVPLLKLRFAQPEMLIDINNIPDLAFHREDADGVLHVGALCRHVDLERSTVLPGRHPTLAACAPLVADPIVRSRGTLVGSLCHSDPQGDWAAAMIALGGEVVARSRRGERRIPVESFSVGPFQNSLEHDEIAVGARVPAPRDVRHGAFLKLERRIGDFATAGLAVALEIAGDGRVTRAGIALTGVGATTLNATDAAEALVGGRLEPVTVERAAELAAGIAQPKSDHRGSSDFKRHVIASFTRRALSGFTAAVAA
ncbi:FAD binding domain-containing protein [Pseudonocardia endophytica]|uniref:Carbon-monoxide dehydrogenase medium subunit n=1 Tax=Pseudonocardia endophytica TaxID=401976 RepID=A0A4R1I069_PSEEN|nr:xanthine dehydrogenase family protein subunit M [Pseudonocardia endophytica]TCK27231.1 carbon-monoxide dehydrogenase medium subunit [Pseudonocardia endophytica]